MTELESYKELAYIFKNHGFKLCIVGGTVRDFLLNLPLGDLDLVTDATPKDMSGFLINADYTFERFGFVKLLFNEYKFDITTLRKECAYKDSRHPSKIEFVNSLEEDVVRRDFTCNGLYMDENLNIYDFVNGQKDIKNKILKTIGKADKRIKEDPLRIIRAVRFSLTYKFEICEELLNAIKHNKDILKLINQKKINEDINKIKNVSKEEIINLFNKLDININLDVIK